MAEGPSHPYNDTVPRMLFLAASGSSRMTFTACCLNPTMRSCFAASEFLGEFGWGCVWLKVHSPKDGWHISHALNLLGLHWQNTQWNLIKMVWLWLEVSHKSSTTHNVAAAVYSNHVRYLQTSVWKMLRGLIGLGIVMEEPTSEQPLILKSHPSFHALIKDPESVWPHAERFTRLKTQDIALGGFRIESEALVRMLKNLSFGRNMDAFTIEIPNPIML